MKVAPNTTVRVANSEAVSLELDVTAELGVVRLRPRFGDEAVIPLDGNAFDWPQLATPNEVTVEWRTPGSTDAAFTTYAEVVDLHYFPLAALRGYGDGRDDFDRLPDEVLWAARQAATDVFEEAAHRCFAARLGKVKDYGRDGLLAASHDLRAVLTDGYAQESDSYIRRTSACGPFPKWVEYTYGAEAMPSAVSAAVLDLAAYTLRPSNRPIGATGESTDAGYIHFTTAGRDGATAIPEVNAAIQLFGAGRRSVW